MNLFIFSNSVSLIPTPPGSGMKSLARVIHIWNAISSSADMVLSPNDRYMK